MKANLAKSRQDVHYVMTPFRKPRSLSRIIATDAAILGVGFVRFVIVI